MTPVQFKLLRKIQHYTDAGKRFNKTHQGGMAPTYVRLRNDGFINSAAPFALMFHNVTITDAGRKALKDYKR